MKSDDWTVIQKQRLTALNDRAKELEGPIFLAVWIEALFAILHDAGICDPDDILNAIEVRMEQREALLYKF